MVFFLNVHLDTRNWFLLGSVQFPSLLEVLMLVSVCACTRSGGDSCAFAAVLTRVQDMPAYQHGLLSACSARSM